MQQLQQKLQEAGLGVGGPPAASSSAVAASPAAPLACTDHLGHSALPAGATSSACAVGEPLAHPPGAAAGGAAAVGAGSSGGSGSLESHSMSMHHAGSGLALPGGSLGMPPLAAFLPPHLTGAHSGGIPLPIGPGGIGAAQLNGQHLQVPGSVDGPRAAATEPGHGGTAAGGAAAPAVAPPADSEVYRTLLRHEAEIARLRRQNRALKQAVCKLDKRLPLCKGSSEEGA